MAQQVFKLKVGEKVYPFNPQELLTVGALRQIKHWFGTEIGRYNAFVSALLQGDPEAALCAVWLARKAAGETNVPEPNELPDFQLASWIDLEESAVEEDEGKPTQQTPQTPDSTEIPTNSDPDISDS